MTTATQVKSINDKFGALIATYIGAVVTIADKADASKIEEYKVSSLLDKTGKFGKANAVGKAGEKAEYVQLVAVADTKTTRDLHPDLAIRLFTNGEDSGLKLKDGLVTLEVTDAGKPTTDTQEATASDAGTMPAAATDAAASEAKPAEKVDKRALRSKQAIERRDRENAEKAARKAKREQEAADRKAKRDAEKAAKPAKEVSKKDKAIAIYNEEIAKGNKRIDEIARFKEELGMAEAGASTYYQNIKSGSWAPAAAPTGNAQAQA